MAPPLQEDITDVRASVRDIIDNFFQILVQVDSYGTGKGVDSANVLAEEIKKLSLNLGAVSHKASNPNKPLPDIPLTLMHYVDQGRNPEIYTREFVEQCRRWNQMLRGKNTAFADFRDVLAGEMIKANPELKEDVEMVLENTGGSVPAKPAGE